MTRFQQRKGFTLVELLVVIGIITILASLLMPALKRAVEMARTAQCMNNEHQISLAMMFYSDDFNGYLPTLGSWGPSAYFTDNWWQVHVSEYTNIKIKNGSSAVRGTIFECPNYKLIANPWIGNNYATNARMAKSAVNGISLFAQASRVRSPGKTLLMGDAGVYGGHYGLGDQYDSNYYSIRHENMSKICVTFVDGHGASLSETVLRNKKETTFTSYKY